MACPYSRNKKLVSAQARPQSGLQYFVITLDARSLCSGCAVFLCLTVCVWKSVFVFKIIVNTITISVCTSVSACAARNRWSFLSWKISARVCLCGYTINKHCTSANTYVSAVVVIKKTRVQTQTAYHKNIARMNTNHMVLISFLSCLCALLGSHHLTNQTRTNHKPSNRSIFIRVETLLG